MGGVYVCISQSEAIQRSIQLCHIKHLTWRDSAQAAHGNNVFLPFLIAESRGVLWRNLCQPDALKLFCLNLHSSVFCVFLVRKAKLFSCHFTPVWAIVLHNRVRLGRLESVAWSPYTQKDIICVESIQRRAARFVCNDYCRSSSLNTMLSNLGRQDLETRRKIADLTMFFKIEIGNVRISFPNDLREVHCPYLTRGSAKHPFHFQRYSSTINAHKKNILFS